MFGIGANELVLILLFGFIVFGPDKLPALAKTIGRAIARFRAAQNEMDRLIKEEVLDPNMVDALKNPLDALANMGESEATKKNPSGKGRSGASGMSAEELYGLAPSKGGKASVQDDQTTKEGKS